MRSDLNEKAIERLGFTPGRWLLVDVAAQRLLLMAGQEVLATWPVSTAAVGVDAREGSGGTPPGVHRIARRIGRDADPGSIFVSREPTGEVWGGQPDPRDLILGRILTLDGCEEGINHGPGVDSRERYIYLHGTNHEDRLGEACSHGCVRLSQRDILDVFERVAEGDPVVIV